MNGIADHALVAAEDRNAVDGTSGHEARIMADADVVAAMSSHRPCRPAPGLRHSRIRKSWPA